MQKTFIFVGVILIASLLVSCASVSTPLMGGLYTEVKAPIAVTGSTGSSKVGTASAQSILGFIATGDASIEAAARQGNITTIHHVDYQAKSILTFFAEFTVFVYGE